MSSVTRCVVTGARGKRHNRSELFTRIIFVVNILIRCLAAAEKAADRVAPRRQPPAQLLPFHTANALLQKGDVAMIAFDGEEA
ncbi:hypothetical protein SB6095_01703 [Klebsiella quasivariicola]|uniref:Uncharacterized protein n=1 Tax=Klebsiella quasivariicola TaxID=2026240 RepID=A0A6C2VEJ9_9ENTR|nr:Uncharacterised protein [Klebsiella quasivariicola]SLY35792.1 Uncharacterised protein [Klebsiella quasivariicola]SXD46399.1 Uncharacterised protein [Klebsiella quasivariicola]SXD94192.1 Uncharacterised protein [Klebsiella quasivariicola]VAN53171.1 Uncharacterised protein [Klebsiella quasivariicola]